MSCGVIGCSVFGAGVVVGWVGITASKGFGDADVAIGSGIGGGSIIIGICCGSCFISKNCGIALPSCVSFNFFAIKK